MSVRVGDRNENHLKVLNQARELRKYTLIATDKVPKSQRWKYATPVVNAIRECMAHIRNANSVWLDENTSDAERNYRRLEQIKAYGCLGTLYELSEEYYEMHYIDGHKLGVWDKLINSTLELLRAWMKSDKK